MADTVSARRIRPCARGWIFLMNESGDRVPGRQVDEGWFSRTVVLRIIEFFTKWYAKCTVLSLYLIIVVHS